MKNHAPCNPTDSRPADRRAGTAAHPFRPGRVQTGPALSCAGTAARCSGKHETYDNMTLFRLTLYLDCGLGFSEQDTLAAPVSAYSANTHSVSAVFELPREVKAIRIDPGELPCLWPGWPCRTSGWKPSPTPPFLWMGTRPCFELRPPVLCSLPRPSAGRDQAGGLLHLLSPSDGDGRHRLLRHAPGHRAGPGAGRRRVGRRR